MKKKLLLIFLSIFIITIFSNSVFAEDTTSIEDNITGEINIDVTAAKAVDNIVLNSENAHETYYVDGSANNQMNDPTIQDAIDNANPGDTIIITGTEYVHCHFVVDKQLNIISNVGTTMSPCPSDTSGSGSTGIFYISESASGTVLSGFTLINDLSRDNTYSLLINGADNVTIDNCKIENINGPGITVTGTSGTTITNSEIKNSNIGILVTDSNNIKITNNLIESNQDSGIHISTGVSDSYIGNNTINANNYNGIKFSSAVNSEIRNNKITNNRDANTQNEAHNGNGIYVDCNITNMVIKGNLIQENGQNGVCNSPNVQNLVDQYVQIIDNNYFIAHNNRGAVTQTSSGTGPVFVWSNYYVLESFCGATFYSPGEYKSTGVKDLILGDIILIEKGVYSVSFIVSGTGEVAKELNSVELTFFLNKEDTNPIPTENDQYITVKVINGTAIADLTDFEYKSTGNVLTVIGPGYGPITTTSTPNRPQEIINIPDSDIPTTTATLLEGKDLTKTFGVSGAYEVTLTDKDGNPLVGQKIQLTINGVTYTRTTDENGQAKLNINLQPGTYTITVIFKGTEEYGISSVNNTIIVKNPSEEKIGSTIEADNYVKEFGVPGAYTITLKDIHGNPLVGQKIELTINGVTYTRTTDENGQAKLNINLQPGTYTITVRYSGTNTYSNSEIRKEITVTNPSDKRLETFINSESFNAVYGENKALTLSLFDENGNILVNQYVQITINGVTYTRTTDNNGIAKIIIRLNPGNYNVVIQYAGNNLYKPISGSNTITVTKSSEKISTTITTHDYTAYYGENKKFVVTLTDESGNLLVNQDVQITINGVTYTRTTDENGQAKLNIKLNTGTYTITSQYLGKGIYSGTASTTNTVRITPSETKYSTILYTENFSQAYGKDNAFTVVLTDERGNLLVNQNVQITINGVTYTRSTDENGVARLTIRLNPGIYDITTEYLGNGLYNPSNTAKNTVIVSAIQFIADNLDSNAIQSIINNAADNTAIKFGNSNYTNINLIIDKPLIIIGGKDTVLIGKKNTPVLSLTENADGTTIDDLNIITNNSTGILINSAADVTLTSNNVTNNLDNSLKSNYSKGDIKMPGIGVNVQNSDNVQFYDNYISKFEHGIYLENSEGTIITGNTIAENNYGITLGSEVANTIIEENNIIKSIGLLTLTVPEGPYGYGIYFKESGVNVTIIGNYISDNYAGLFINSENSTGIVIKGNTITQSVVEGITFNVNYTYTENASQPIVEDNAIYNNAKGPSMMILGEVSANPEGIYGPGEWDDNLKLVLGPNWYGTNTYVTWGENSTGPGTICPRIKTTLITFNITYEGNGNYDITFYKDKEIATNLADLEIYATLNFNSTNPNKSNEIAIIVQNGVGSFSFDADSYNSENNLIYISCGSLFDQNRIYQVIDSYNVPASEIPN